MRVLVVEDDAKIASFVVRGLKQAGYAVDHAPDGETGLALAESTGYDVAIVDVMLPGLDGFSLVRRLRSARRQVPVLFLSAKSAVEDRVHGPRERRRRLPDEALRVLGAARAGPGPDPQGDARPRRDAAGRRATSRSTW